MSGMTEAVRVHLTISTVKELVVDFLSVQIEGHPLSVWDVEEML
jgi:hypothetical protein